MSSASTKAAIADAAAREFKVKGYSGASMSSIADRLGLTKGALVYHFRAKADFISYFTDVVRGTTANVIEQARQKYPEDGARRVLFYTLLLSEHMKNCPQFDGGIALFLDSATPEMQSGDLAEQWMNFSVEAFEQCASQGRLREGVTPLEAAELLMINHLGTAYFGRLVHYEDPETASIRFVREALRASGILNVDKIAAEVVEDYRKSGSELECFTV